MRRLSIMIVVSAVALFLVSSARAADQGPSVGNSGDVGVVIPSPSGSIEAQRQGVPNVLGPTNYVPAAPSDELRQDMLRPFQPKEEAPAPRPAPVMDDNTA